MTLLPASFYRCFSSNRIRRTVHTFAVLGLLLTAGCATDVARWIAQARNHQGDVSLARDNDADAAEAYELALKVDPHNEHARTGFVSVQLRIALDLFTHSKFEDAIDALAYAARYSPGDDRIEALRSQIEQAEIKRDIVISNFPSFKETSTNIRRSFIGVGHSSEKIGRLIAQFEYTYDTTDLTKAIGQSYELNAEIARETTRLINLRQLADSGAPESKADESLAAPASLLPLP